MLLILGNQLFARAHLPRDKMPVFMAEDVGLCTHFKYHKHKLILFLAAMREHAGELRKAGYELIYRELEAQGVDEPYEEKLAAAVEAKGIERLVSFEIEDKFFEQRIRAFCESRKLDWEVLPTPMFLTSRPDFAAYLRSAKKPFMRVFYEQQRRRLNIMMEGKKPRGGQFSFDADNRLALPKSLEPPEPWMPAATAAVKAVSAIIDSRFLDHPGQSEHFWLPVTRRDALRWLRDFLTHRFADFGPYEDAIPGRGVFLFHSVISPTINLGLLTPSEIIDAAIEHAQSHEIPIASLEGFVRQIIGWREFVRGIYQNFSQTQDTANFWKHSNPLGSMWYRGDSGIPPLDYAINKLNRYGWCHHIERLMVLGNLMQLCGIDPRAAHRYFMEMFVDSSDWVMGPNVYGMGLFSDGGIFATKPYLCGSNYLRKMSGTPAGEWCDVVDGLYWSFIDKHRDFFEKNPRTRNTVRNLERLSKDRRTTIYALANAFRKRATAD